MIPDRFQESSPNHFHLIDFTTLRWRSCTASPKLVCFCSGSIDELVCLNNATLEGVQVTFSIKIDGFFSEAHANGLIFQYKKDSTIDSVVPQKGIRL